MSNLRYNEKPKVINFKAPRDLNTPTGIVVLRTFQPEENFPCHVGSGECLEPARMSESVMQKFHELTPQGQLQEEIQTLKSQNERLAKLLDRCVHAVEQEYGIANWRVEEAKALLAEIKQ